MPHSVDLTSLLELLKVQTKPKEKAMLLESNIDNHLHLLAVLRVATHVNLNIHKLKQFRKKMWVTKRNPKVVPEDFDVLRVALRDDKDVVITQSTLDFFSYMISPKALGVSIAQLHSILAVNPISLESACELLGLQKEFVQDTPLKVCSICSRHMKVLVYAGLCRSCTEELLKYPEYRRGYFEVPINKHNFRFAIGRLNTQPLEVVSGDYQITKQKEVIRYTPTSPSQPTVVPLPFVEYQKSIA